MLPCQSSCRRLMEAPCAKLRHIYFQCHCRHAAARFPPQPARFAMATSLTCNKRPRSEVDFCVNTSDLSLPSTSFPLQSADCRQARTFRDTDWRVPIRIRIVRHHTGWESRGLHGLQAIVGRLRTQIVTIAHTDCCPAVTTPEYAYTLTCSPALSTSTVAKPFTGPVGWEGRLDAE
jgi:hypothetical protein